jgi:hypothetical protein
VEALPTTDRSGGSRSHRLAWLLAAAIAAAYALRLYSLDLGRSMTRISSPGEAGWWGLAILVLAAVALGMLVADLVVAGERRPRAIGLLLAGLAYALLNIGAFVAALALDRFAIFEPAYVRAASLVAPVLAMAAVILLALRRRWSGWLGLLGSVAWIGSIGLAHLWVIAQASASV